MPQGLRYNHFLIFCLQHQMNAVVKIRMWLYLSPWTKICFFISLNLKTSWGWAVPYLAQLKLTHLKLAMNKLGLLSQPAVGGEGGEGCYSVLSQAREDFLVGTNFWSKDLISYYEQKVFWTWVVDMSCEQELWEIVVNNTSLAVKGALSHRLQRRTACKIQNGCQGAPKWPTGSGNVSTPRFLGVLSIFG